MNQKAIIEEFMTPHIHTVGADMPLAKAAQMMRQYGIRHLPVLEAGKLIGIITDRDIKSVEGLKDVDPTQVLVRDAMTEPPFSVSPRAPLADVCIEMANHKYGSALVVDQHKLVGIFTWIDALKAMSGILKGA